MRLASSSYRALLDRTATSISRPFSTTLPTLESRSRDDSPSTSRHRNQERKIDRVSNTLLTASRLGNHADKITKEQSDQYSGWKRTPGPSTRRNVGRPKLSSDASRALNKAKASENVEVLLGAYASEALLKPLKDARQFITPRAEILPGDFVELRRRSVAVGIVLPAPEDASGESRDAQMKKTDTRDLFVLVANGQIVLYKDSDVMIKIPGVIEAELTEAAAATSRKYVVTSNSIDPPSHADGSHDEHSTNSNDANPMDGTAMDEEPLDIPRFEARASICNKLRLFERQKEKELQRILPFFQSLFLINSAHDDQSRKNRMDVRTGTITTYEAARLVQELQVKRNASSKTANRKDEALLTAITIYATHTLLMSHPSHFLADPLSHRTSQLFTCRSDEEKRNLELISGWMASPAGSQGQKYIDSFCDKAKRIREFAEANPHDFSGPPRTVPAPHPDLDMAWTNEDRAIIDFLEASLGSRREVQHNTHGSLSMAIIKRAHGHFRMLPHPNVHELLPVDVAAEQLLPEDERKFGKEMLQQVGTDVVAGFDLQHALVLKFLTQIGALPVWQNPIRLDASFRTATAGDEPESGPDSSAASPPPSVEVNTSKYNLTLDHEVENIRHDFGRDHTVYVIDDEGAFELDDGISVEMAEGREDQAWVHVHVADPTALVRPEDELGQRAERRFASVYFPEARWAMLPDDFVRAGVGLSQKQANGEPQRVMTFSALVDLDTGLVQDWKARPALVYDVQTVSYNHVSSLLTGTSSGEQDAREKQLGLLWKIAVQLSENRARGTGIVAHRARPVIKVSPLPLAGVPVAASQRERPYFFAGFPHIELCGNDTWDSSGTPPVAQFLVAELMILAGRIAAAFGKEHNLAMAFRYQPRPQTDRETREMLESRTNVPAPLTGGRNESLSPVVPGQEVLGHGIVRFDELLVRGLALSSSSYSSSPMEHFSLGIGTTANTPGEIKDALTGSGYVRATSPLRRYPDMLAHYQIKSHLVSSKPRFGPYEIQKLLPQFERQEANARQLMRSAERFWLYTLLQRSLLQPPTRNSTAQAGLTAANKMRFTAKVMLTEVRVSPATLSARVRVNIEELGVPADLEWDPRGDEPKSGDVFTVEPVSVIMAGIRGGLVVRRV